MLKKLMQNKNKVLKLMTKGDKRWIRDGESSALMKL